MSILAVGVDISKNYFQIHAVNENGKVELRKKATRDNFINTLNQIPKCKIYMEACGGSNYWGARIKDLGHEVKLISPQYVKPFVKSNKNDRNDAEAIVEAGIRPSMRFVELKAQWQQDIQSTHKIRERLVTERTALVNQIRGLLQEYGIVIPQGINKIRKELPKIVEENGFSGLMKGNISDLYEELTGIDGKIKKYEERIKSILKDNEICQELIKIPGVGVLGATMLIVELGNTSVFKNGRHFAAFLGLVPRQHSTGGKDTLLGISKRGNVYLRKLLIHGGRAVMRFVGNKKNRESLWLKSLEERAGMNKSAVAWANKIARKAFAIAHSKGKYVQDHIPKLNNSKSVPLKNSSEGQIFKKVTISENNNSSALKTA